MEITRLSETVYARRTVPFVPGAIRAWHLPKGPPGTYRRVPPRLSIGDNE